METKMIGNKIAKARKKLNISQAQLAENLFISAQAVGKWERGESMPDILTLTRLSEIFGVDLNYFTKISHSNENEEKIVDLLPKQSSVIQLDENIKRPNRNMSANSWIDADFSGLNNINEDFNCSKIPNCKFIGSDLAGLNLKSNQIFDCDFSKSNLSRCRFQATTLTSNCFNESSLIETEFSACTIKGCDFVAANLSKAFFNNSTFIKNKITNVILDATTFNNTRFDEVVFEGTIENCHFESSSFKGVIFQNTTIINTFFKYNKKLNRVQFINCKVDGITYAFLKSGEADLTGVTILSK